MRGESMTQQRNQTQEQLFAAQRLQGLFKLHGHRLTFVPVKRGRDRNGNTVTHCRVFAGLCEDVTREVAAVIPRSVTLRNGPNSLGLRAATPDGTLRTIRLQGPAGLGAREVAEALSVALYFDGQRISAEVV